MRAATGATAVYLMDGRLYVNLTSRCGLRCRFCFKWQERQDFFGHRLLMAREAAPPVDEVDRLILSAPDHTEPFLRGGWRAARLEGDGRERPKG